MDFNFKPTSNEKKPTIPDFEDARAINAPYYSSRKSIKKAQAEISELMAELGAMVLRFQEGIYEGKRKRQGYEIRFVYEGVPGIIRVAGLPIRYQAWQETKQKRVKVQALLIARDWIKSWITQRIFNPGYDPLIPYLLVDGRPLVEHIQLTGGLPQLEAKNREEIVDGDFVEA